MASSHRKVSRTFVARRALRTSGLRRMLMGFLIFNVGEWAAWITLLVWAFGEHGVSGASLIALAQLVPAALLAPVCIRLLTKGAGERALSYGYALQAALHIATGAVLLADAADAVIVGVAVLGSITITLSRPVHNTLLPEICETAEDLTVGNSASGTVEGVAVFLGPLVSGLLIVSWGPGGVLLALGCASVVGSLITLNLGKPSASSTTYAAAPVKTSAGLNEVLRDRTGRLLGALVLAEYALIGMADILLVVLALDVLGMNDSGPGILNSALGIGGLVGAAATIALIGRKRLAPAVILGALVAGIPFAFAGLSTVVWTALVLVAATGAGKLFFDVASRTLAQRALPEKLLSGVFSLQEATMMGGLALGVLVAPLLVESIGTTWAFVAAGLFLPLLAVAAWRPLMTVDRGASVSAADIGLIEVVPFLAVLTPLKIERLAQRLERKTVEARTPVIKRGAAGDTFYIIESGTATVTIDRAVIRELGPGDWFGELALLNDAPRSATVTTTTSSILGVVHREPFLEAVTGAHLSLTKVGEHIQTYET